jgi:hypothetical protein
MGIMGWLVINRIEFDMMSSERHKLVETPGTNEDFVALAK